MSVWVLTQVPEQLERPAWQDSVHLPDEQTCPAAQVAPHFPQLYTSVWVLTQVPLQLLSPERQVSEHLPDEQAWPA